MPIDPWFYSGQTPEQWYITRGSKVIAPQKPKVPGVMSSSLMTAPYAMGYYWVYLQFIMFLVLLQYMRQLFGQFSQPPQDVQPQPPTEVPGILYPVKPGKHRKAKPEPKPVTPKPSAPTPGVGGPGYYVL